MEDLLNRMNNRIVLTIAALTIVPFILNVVLSTSYHREVLDKIEARCGEAVDSTETQGFGAVDAGDQPVTETSVPVNAVHVASPEMARQMEICHGWGSSYGIAYQHILCVVHVKDMAEANSVNDKCVRLGGHYLGQLGDQESIAAGSGLDALCDLSGVK